MLEGSTRTGTATAIQEETRNYYKDLRARVRYSIRAINSEIALLEMHVQWMDIMQTPPMERLGHKETIYADALSDEKGSLSVFERTPSTGCYRGRSEGPVIF